jgi:hypothetical protein
MEEDFSKEEILTALKNLKEKYPTVYKWFFLFELLRQREPDESKLYGSL